MNMALEFAPPLVIGKADIDEAVRILDGASRKKRRRWACEVLPDPGSSVGSIAKSA